MPSLATEQIEQIRRESEEISAALRELYRKASKGAKGKRLPRGLEDRQRVTAERRIKAKIDELTKKSQKFYEVRLQESFMAGAKAAKDDYVLAGDDLALLSKISDDGMTKINTANELAKRDVNRWGQVAEGSRYKAQTKKHDVRGMITTDGKRYRPDTYRTLVMAADSSRTYNFGVLAGAEAAAIEHVIIRDGTGCGLSSHNDPQEANGLVLTLDEARAHPIAHPYCQRTFEPYHGNKKPGSKLRSLAKTSAKVAAVGSVAAVAGAVALKNSETLQEKLTILLAKANPAFLEYRARVLQVAAAKRQSFEDVSQALRDEMDRWVEDETHELSQQAASLIGVRERAPRKVVGDSYDYIVDGERFAVMGQSDLDMMNSIGGHTLGSIIDDAGGHLSFQAPKAFLPGRSVGAGLEGRGWRAASRLSKEGVGGSGSKVISDSIRIGASKSTKGDTVIKYVNFHPNQFFRYRVSSVKYGVANRFVLNPNGVLRAGFAIDPRTGFVTPSLRFLPRGPLRIYNEINRGQGTMQTGDLLGNKIKKALSLAKKRKGKTAITQTVKFEDILRRGASGQAGFLMEDDFATGAVKEILSSDGIIRRGRIPAGLSVVDPATGKRTAVDLIIRNGKFVKEHIARKGAITSVSTTVQVNIYKGLKFNLRTNLNLRGLELNSLADIRHLRLRQLATINPAKNFRIRSASIQLRMFGHSIFEIGKILRMPWEDMQRLWRDTTALMDAAYRKQLMQKYEQRVAELIGGPGETEVSKQLIAERVKGLPSEVRQKVSDVPGLLRDSAVALKQEWVDDPVKWVMGTRERLVKLRDSAEIKYKRPKIEAPSSIEDFLNRKTKDGPASPRFLSAVEREQAEDLTNVIYFSPAELATELDISIEDAEEMHRRALIVLRDELGLDKAQVLPERIAKHFGGQVEIHDVTSMLDEAEFKRATQTADTLNGFADGTTARAMAEDVQTVAAYLEENYPDLPPVRFRMQSAEVATSGGARAEYLEASEIKSRIREQVVSGNMSEVALDDLADNTAEIWIYPAGANHWFDKLGVGPARGWTIQQFGGMNDGLSTMMHESGHHAHLAWQQNPKFGKVMTDRIFKELMPGETSSATLWVQDHAREIIKQTGSTYATSNFYEFMAEMFNYGNQYPGKSKLADYVVGLMKETWG